MLSKVTERATAGAAAGTATLGNTVLSTLDGDGDDDDRSVSVVLTANRIVAAKAARPGVRRRRRHAEEPLVGRVVRPGITPPGTASSADTIRADPAMIPLASATAAAQLAHSAACFAACSASSGGSAPSNQAWIVPSSRCCMRTPSFFVRAAFL
jgi:hypothetical protein